ncbi:hypothetical protein EC988_004726 [Linderina pennispora]|nr:hypothetical protein EC988_004726 [Linderina pennispora]
MAQSTLEFRVDTDLLNPRFEGYQLRLLDDDTAIRSFALGSGPVQPRQLPSNTYLTYDETSHRVRFNHLFPGPLRDTFMYIDKGGCLNMMHVGRDDVQATCMFVIPEPEASSAIGGYPSAFALSQDLVLVFDGFEDVFILRRATGDQQQGPKWRAVGRFTIGQGHVVAGSTDSKSAMFQYTVLAAHLKQKPPHGAVRIFVCHRVPTPTLTTSAEKHQLRSNSRFCIESHEVKIPPAEHGAEQLALLSSVSHTLTSHAIPLYCQVVPGTDNYLLGVKGGIVAEDTELGSATGTPGALNAELELACASPYYWMQEPADVTVCIQLPAPVTASQISCSMTSLGLTLEFMHAPECSHIGYTEERFFDEIDADSSVWTLENGQLLTLYLEKSKPNVRWATVFSQDDGVLETMDRNEFAQIRERLEKYTSSDLDSRSRSHAPLPAAISSMDMDDDDLDNEDSGIVFSVRDAASGADLASSVGATTDWLCPCLPAAVEPGCPAELPPVCLQSDVDAVIFAFSRSPVPAPRHTCTFPAMAFIQASKREKRLMYTDAEMHLAILAEARRRIYVYRRPAKDQVNAGQNIIDIDNGQQLLGIQVVGDIIVVLCEDCVCLVDVRCL